MMKNLNELIATAENSDAIQVVSGSNRKYSFSIANSQNGKRLSFGKTLVKDTELADTVFVLPSTASDEIFVSNTSISDKCSYSPLSGSDKKVSYSAPLVKMIVDTSGISFGDHTSKSFADISIEDLNSIKVARISIVQPETEAKIQTENEADA